MLIKLASVTAFKTVIYRTYLDGYTHFIDIAKSWTLDAIDVDLWM